MVDDFQSGRITKAVIQECWIARSDGGQEGRIVLSELVAGDAATNATNDFILDSLFDQFNAAFGQDHWSVRRDHVDRHTLIHLWPDTEDRFGQVIAVTYA